MPENWSAACIPPVKLAIVNELPAFAQMGCLMREYLKRGEIRGKLIGKRWRFRRADLDAFFENAPSQWDFGGKNNHGD